jgi:hypothetical protein
MLSVDHFRRFIVTPALQELSFDMCSPAAVELLVGTALIESRLELLKQGRERPGDGEGVALGLYQIEPRSHDDLWLNYLAYQPQIRAAFSIYRQQPSSRLITDLAYATKIARLIYWRSPKPLPNAGDLNGLAQMWKQVYNTMMGAGDPNDFVRVYNQYACL